MSHGSGDNTVEQATENNQDNGAASGTNAQNQQSQQQTEEELQAQKIATLTHQLINEGYTTVLQGEVKEHLDQFSTGTTYVTYYIKLDEASNICGYPPGGVGVKPTTKTTQTIVPSSNYKGKFPNEDAVRAFYSKLKGKKVLVGFNDGTEEIGWPGGVPCNMTLHSQYDCELMNAGIPAYMRDLEVLEID